MNVFTEQEALFKQGGGEKGKKRQARHGRLIVRERLDILLDNVDEFMELGLWAGYEMYPEWGPLPAAGVITGIGKVSGHTCMIIANDATVKAGAMFPQSIKKVLRAQRIAYHAKLPTLFLVDSAGVFLPLQDEIFPDEDDFGRIFRNNAIFSASGIPQIAAIMGNCIAGGAYLPVLCDKLLMTKGSGLYLAGQALVKAAIGQDVDAEELGGAKMHAELSGTVDFLEEDDPSCLVRMRTLVGMLPEDHSELDSSLQAELPAESLYNFISEKNQEPYETKDLLRAVVDNGSLQESKAEYGKTLVTAYARMGGKPVGIVANQKMHSTSGEGEVELGGVIYADSADKAARFVMDCNQTKVPLLFFQDVTGFMIGPRAESSGIIRSGAKLVSAVSNSIVPKITVIVGNSFGAGHYALCGKAYDPLFLLAWPNARYSVMGGEQAASTLFDLEKKALGEEEAEKRRKELQATFEKHIDIRYGAARGWVDAIIDPSQTRDTLLKCLEVAHRCSYKKAQFHTGVIQV